jgi:hypothetical protein
MIKRKSHGRPHAGEQNVEREGVMWEDILNRSVGCRNMLLSLLKITQSVSKAAEITCLQTLTKILTL